MDLLNYIFNKLKICLLITCLFIVAMSTVYSQLEIFSVGSVRNPAFNLTNISLLGKTETSEGVFNNPIYFKEISVMTLNGILIILIENANTLSIDLPLINFAKGIYLIQLTDYNGNKYFGKLVKN